MEILIASSIGPMTGQNINWKNFLYVRPSLEWLSESILTNKLAFSGKMRKSVFRSRVVQKLCGLYFQTSFGIKLL